MGPDGFCRTPHVWMTNPPFHIPHVTATYKDDEGTLQTFKASPGYMLVAQCRVCPKCVPQHFAYEYVGGRMVDVHPVGLMPVQEVRSRDSNTSPVVEEVQED